MGTHYADVVSSHLHSCFLTELNQLKKKVEMLSQENKEMQGDCALLQQHVEDLKPSYKKQEEEDSDFQTQHQKVGTGRWLRVMCSPICPLGSLSVYPSTSAL